MGVSRLGIERILRSAEAELELVIIAVCMRAYTAVEVANEHDQLLAGLVLVKRFEQYLFAILIFDIAFACLLEICLGRESVVRAVCDAVCDSCLYLTAIHSVRARAGLC